MKKIASLIFLFCISAQSYAGFVSRFKNDDGSTKWQHVANFSSSVLILTLLVVALFLFLANRRASRANRELTEIKATLEDRVERRTASLIEATADLKSREEYIRNIVESMPLMLIGVNSKMEITQWNHVAETQTGRSLNSVLGKRLWDVYPTITLTPEQVTQVLDSKETMTIKHSQRDQYYFDITLYALTDKGDTGVVILVDDITKQMKAENKVAERDKMSAMGELASAMAYDINLPLQSILSSLVNAQHALSEKEATINKDALIQTFIHARESGQQASAIIQNLLELASSHTDKKEPADLAQIMDTSIELAATLFSDLSGLQFSDIKITRRYSTDLPSTSCFNSEILQVFTRLLRNAFHSLNALTHDKGKDAIAPAIHVDISEFYDSLWIKVQHNGRVLSPYEQEDIFQPFFSLSSREPACPVEHRLSYSHFIITNHHGGQMSVTSDEKFGTTFNIQLPIA